MERGPSWEEVHKILFPGGPVPNQANGPHSATTSGAGILGPRPASPASASGPPPGFGLQQNASNLQASAPQAGGLTSNRAPEDGMFGSPPPAPRDPKLLHYIKLFAAFVAKYGIENEAVVRAKHRGRPEFSFLFGGEPGSEASIGSIFYEWQKDVIVKVLDAMKGLAEGKIPPDRIKSMRRELEQCINNGEPLKDLRVEAVLGFPDGKLDWQKIAWELGVTLPGDKRSQLEAEKKPGIIGKKNGDVDHDLHTKEWSLKPEKPPPRDSNNEEFSPGSRRRRNRSRSRSPDRARYRFRSRSPPPRRSPRRSRTPPPRRNRRSYSRSPPWRRSSPPPLPPRRSPPPPRRANDRKRELEDEHVMPFPPPYATQQFHHLPPPPPSILHPNGGGAGAGGFMENSFARFMPPVLESVGASSSSSSAPPPLQNNPAPPPVPPPPPISQDPGSLMFSQVGVGAPLALPEIPVNHLLQQLQFPQMPGMGNQVMVPQLAPNAWPSLAGDGAGAAPHQFVSPAQLIAPLFNNHQLPQQHQLPHPEQQQQQAMNHREKNDLASPSNDAELDKRCGEDDDDQRKKCREEEPGREKDSRALKIVRNTVAEFVKELLTPKWKDGILSKDDFKVIAQKAVNKVVGNLQGSQIPKGSERVDRFMTSSREKITKLVQEYVEKHTKNAPAPASTTTTTTTAEAAA